VGLSVFVSVVRGLCTWGRRHWAVVLAGMACALLAVNIVAFYPGFLSNDSIDQLTQASGDKPLEDWHPPVMAVVWRVLLEFSGGRIGAMVVWQCVLLWAALGILAVYVYKRSGQRWLSMMPLGLGGMPFVINLSGVIWKDVQMAVSLLLAAVLLIVLEYLVGRRRYVVLSAAGLLIIYAGSIRYNALIAAMPLLWLVWRALRFRRAASVAIGLIVAGCLLLTPLVARIGSVASTHPVASIMLDDIVYIYDSAAIQKLDISDRARQALLAVDQHCETKALVVSVWIGCATEQDFYTITRTEYDNTKRVWMHAVTHHPLTYATFRLGQYGVFLAPRTAAEAYVWHEGIVPNHYSLIFRSNTLTAIVKGYVYRASIDFGFIFRPYVWLAGGIALVLAAWRRRAIWQHSSYCIALAASGVLYIVSYIPMVVAYDFRYTYWSCLAVSVAFILALVDSQKK
jgi:hypothetical protein